MKTWFSLTLLVLFGCTIDLVAGYGPRGAAERVSYYLAYLAEEESYVTKGAFNVAPGCLGSREVGGLPTKRCTLKEFLLYIWKEQPSAGDVNRPTDFNIFADMDEDPTEENINQLISKINQARTNQLSEAVGTPGTRGYKPPGKAVGITGNSDAAKLWPGGGDYYDVLARMGDPINAMPRPYSAAAQRIADLAKDASKAVVGLRWEDMEKFRLKSLAKKLGFAVSTQTWDVGYQGRQINILDVPKTISDNPYPSVATDVTGAANDYATQSATQQEHFKAISSGQTLSSSLGCALPVNNAGP